MVRRIFAALLLVAFSLVAAVPLGVAQGKGKGKGHNKNAEEAQGDKRGVNIIFSVRDREVIRDYYFGRNSNLPPGLAKRGGNLPPGLQKHLERDGTLPPGLQKRVEPFPVELERRLPRLPQQYRRVSIGVDVLILDRRTQRIMDVIHDILRP